MLLSKGIRILCNICISVWYVNIIYTCCVYYVPILINKEDNIDDMIVA